MADTPAEDPLKEQLDEIMSLHLCNTPVEKVLPLVEKVFEGLDQDQACQLLDFLPWRLTPTIFLKTLDGPPSKRLTHMAKANLAALEAIDQTDEKKQQMYLLLHGALGTEPAFHAEAQRMLVQFLATFGKGPFTAAAEEQAAAAVVHALKSQWDFDEVFVLPAVQALAKSGDAGRRQLLELFTIFCSHGHPEFAAFFKRGAPADTWGLDVVDLEEKIRLLTLCQMGQEKRKKKCHVLSYSEIAARLAIAEDEVEATIIRGVGLGLLTARADQIKQSVTVGHTHHALFEREQWQELNDSLSVWKSTVGGLVKRCDDLLSSTNALSISADGS